MGRADIVGIVGHKDYAVEPSGKEGDVPGGLVGRKVTCVWMVVVSGALA